MSGKQNPCTICQETGGIAQETEDPTKLVASAPFKSLRPNIGHLPIFLRKHSLWVEPVDFPSLCMHQDARRQPSTFWSAVACSYRRWDRDWRGLDFHFFWSDYWCYRKLAKSAFLLLYLIYLRMFYLSYIPNHIIHTYIHTYRCFHLSINCYLDQGQAWRSGRRVSEDSICVLRVWQKGLSGSQASGQDP